MSAPPTAPSRASGSPLPAIVVCGILLTLAAFTWPQILVRFVSLQWQVGNVTSAAGLLSTALAVAALGAWICRRWLSSRVARMFTSKRQCLYSAGAILLALAVFAGLSEFALRVFQVPFRLGWTPAEYRISRFDPGLGWSYLPNLSTVQRFGSEGRTVAIYTDAMGSRVADRNLHLDPAAPTVVLAGCSYTFGHGLQYQETFAGRLAAIPGFPYQVLNLGVQGYGTDQSLLSMEQVLPKVNAKVVIYTFLLDHVKRNDNADRRFIFPKARFPGTKPRFVVDRDGSLRQVSHPHRYEDMLDCHLCDLVELFWNRWGPQPSIPLTRALVKAMKEYVESRGAVFVLVLWTNPHQVPTEQLEQALFPGLKANVVDVGAGAPPAFTGWMIPGETHPDARAHAFVATRIGAKLGELGLIASSPPPTELARP
ncbi:MAG: hypothetical protein L0Z52_04570 [Acidobacteria bacterium]|nr:hypothetical protein [Acidobacteriota bacterium]